MELSSRREIKHHEKLRLGHYSQLKYLDRFNEIIEERPDYCSIYIPASETAAAQGIAAAAGYVVTIDSNIDKPGWVEVTAAKDISRLRDSGRK